MLSPQAIFKGLVYRILPTPMTDGSESEKALRISRYGDAKTENSWPVTDHLLADEGAYITAAMSSGATKLWLGLSATFVNSAAAFVLSNSDPPGGRRIYPRRLRLCQVDAPVNGTSLRYSIWTDSRDRTPSTISSGAGGTGPGTPFTATAYQAPTTSTNQDVRVSPAGLAYFPLSTNVGAPPLVPTPGPAARCIVGQGFLKQSIPVTKDQYILQFGCQDSGGAFQIAAALAHLVAYSPPVVIGPGQCMVIHLWSQLNDTTGSSWDDVALEWFER